MEGIVYLSLFGRTVVSNRKLLLVWCIVGALIILWVLVSPNIFRSPEPPHPQATASSPPIPAPVRQNSMRDTVHVGYWSYVVWDDEWKKTLGSQYLHKQADAEFLVLRIAVVNNDKTASVIPPFKLVDYEGREYDESSDAAVYLPRGFGILKSVNPSVRADGYIAFDVPRGGYVLKVSGGFTSGKTALIGLY